jgi:hypothetical protein
MKSTPQYYWKTPNTTYVFILPSMDPQYVEQRKAEVAQEKFGAETFEELSPKDRQRVGGTVRTNVHVEKQR